MISLEFDVVMHMKPFQTILVSRCFFFQFFLCYETLSDEMLILLQNDFLVGRNH